MPREIPKAYGPQVMRRTSRVLAGYMSGWPTNHPSGINNTRDTQRGQREGGKCELRGLPVEGVDLLGARVAKQKRRIVGSHA